MNPLWDIFDADQKVHCVLELEETVLEFSAYITSTSMHCDARHGIYFDASFVTSETVYISNTKYTVQDVLDMINERLN